MLVKWPNTLYHHQCAKRKHRVWALLYNQPLFDRKGAIVHGEIDLATARIGEIPEDEEGEGAE